MVYKYKTKNICAKEIDFEIEEGVIKNVSFLGGCDGNLKALPVLIEGQDAVEIADKLKNITCGSRDTSCAGQLSKAISEALEEHNEKYGN